MVVAVSRSISVFFHDVDAIAITHSHADHWHLPSILRYAFDEATPVIVPDTRRPSILTFQDFADALTTIGQSSGRTAFGLKPSR